MPLRLLCLHGWGTSVKFTDALMRELKRDNTAEFHLIEGDLDSEPGPGIDGFYEGPFYSYYKFPRSFEDSDESMLEAYELLDEIVEEQGPFDGVLGFSHGGTLASGWLMHRATTQPFEPLPVRCAVFLNSLPPFRMNPGEDPVVDEGFDEECSIQIPTVSVAGTKDFVYDYSIKLHRLCDPRKSQLVVHNKGHDIPGDSQNVTAMARAIRKLPVFEVNLPPRSAVRNAAE
ncbi:MAG: hypothetical protein Q9227_008951 [Pyrenula ochraceoflavens]